MREYWIAYTIKGNASFQTMKGIYADNVSGARAQAANALNTLNFKIHSVVPASKVAS
jgi:hypothetical protein